MTNLFGVYSALSQAQANFVFTSVPGFKQSKVLLKNFQQPIIMLRTSLASKVARLIEQNFRHKKSLDVAFRRSFRSASVVGSGRTIFSCVIFTDLYWRKPRKSRFGQTAK